LPETIDAAIYLAGINIVKPVEEMTIEEWQKVIDINLTGAFRFAKTCLPGLKRAGTSTFVGISSIMATHPYPNRSPYAASKAGLEGLIRQLAVEWGKYGIATQGVRLGHLEGLMKTGTKSTELLDTVKKHVPSGILIQPEDVGSYIAWLCSGRAQAISGGIIDFDPAYSINRWPL
jgi:3-oxoacyl-[acyl-carrier protein] reductase